MTKKKIAHQIEKYMSVVTQAGKFSGAILLSQAGQILHSAGYGLADREHQIANAPNTKFRLGSITKQFTAMAVLMLEEQGKLTVRDPIRRHLPYSPDHWRGVTIHHLLNHTSGLGNLADIPGCQETTARLPLCVREIVETFRETPLEFRPGTQYRYSNSGYFLLGDIIEHVSGVSYEDFLRDHIFNPLGMADSGYDRYETILKNRATGYRRQNGDWVRASYLDMGYPFAAGALYSTVEDLFRWDQALLASCLISPESHARMMTVTPLLSCYGYGLILGREQGRRTVGHAGGINGFRANFVRYPDEPACVIVLSNSEATDFRAVTQALAAIVFGEEYEVPVVRTPIDVGADVLSSYEGTYQLASGATLNVEAKSSSLVVTCGEARKIVSAGSETVFFDEDGGDGITFPVARHGGAGHLILTQAQVELVAQKIEATTE